MFFKYSFSFFFYIILVVLYCSWHIVTSFYSFFFIILLLSAFVLRLKPANIPLDGSFDSLISVMNQRNIARLSNGILVSDCNCETVELSRTLTAVREAVGIEGGQETGRGHRPLCHAPADPRRTTESEMGLGGGERKVSTFLSPPYYNRWGWRSKCGRG